MKKSMSMTKKKYKIQKISGLQMRTLNITRFSIGIVCFLVVRRDLFGVKYVGGKRFFL